MAFTHYAFSDDSKHNDGRYNSLAISTLRKEDYDSLNNQLNELLKGSNIHDEFKWSKVRNAKYRIAAEKIINFLFQNQNSMRIDIVIWDLEDERHRDVRGRDDSENLVRMYYHLVSATLSNRWPISGSIWRWHPDDQSSVDWNTLQECINNKVHIRVADLFQQNPNFESVKLNSITPSNSIEHPFIQVSDLFAGIASYSYGHFNKYKNWNEQNNLQLLLYNKVEDKFSSGEVDKFKVIKKFNEMAKKQKMQIAFDSTNGFKSHKPANFINFWLYTPQSVNDRAPVTIKNFTYTPTNNNVQLGKINNISE